jgi:hypothetical protein
MRSLVLAVRRMFGTWLVKARAWMRRGGPARLQWVGDGLVVVLVLTLASAVRAI